MYKSVRDEPTFCVWDDRPAIFDVMYASHNAVQTRCPSPGTRNAQRLTR